MNRIKDDEMKIRLKQLRNMFGYTQPVLFSKLKEYINDRIEDTNDKIYLDDKEGGKSTISQLENGNRSLEDYYALAYADVLDVSLDYIYGRIKNLKPEYKGINEQLGLNDNAIKKLEELNKNDKNIIDILNKLLSPNLAPLFIELLDALFEHSSVDIKARVSQYPGNTFLTEQNSKGYYKKPIMLKPKDLEYQSLFTISEISKNIANELKKNGGK